MIRKSLKVAIALALGLGAHAALAQTYTVANLPSAAIIDSVASNGSVLYEIDQQTGSTLQQGGYYSYGYYNPPQYYNTGTQTYFLTGANGIGSTQIAQASAYEGESYDQTSYLYYQNGGTNPAGPVSAYPPTTIPTFKINSSGSAVAILDSVYNEYANVQVGGVTTTYSGPFNPGNPTPLPDTISDTGALAGSSNGSSNTNNLYYWSPGSTSTSPDKTTVLAGQTFSTSNPYSSGLSISSTTNQIAGSVFGGGGYGEESFYTAANDGAVTYIANTGAILANAANTINDSGQIGGYLYYSSGGNLVQTAFITDVDGNVVVLGAGAAGDQTSTLFVNDAGEAIIDDYTNGDYYLYDNGSLYSVASLFGVSDTDQVVGLTNAGGVVFADPGVYTPVSLGDTGVVNTSTTDFMNFASAETGSSGSSGSSVPAPASTWLFGLGVFAVLFGRFRGARKSAAIVA